MSYSPTSASDALNELTAEETMEFDQIIADGVTHNVTEFATKEDLFALFLTAGSVYVRNTQAPSLWYPIGDNTIANVRSATQIVDSLNGVTTKVMTMTKSLSPGMEAALANSGANVGSTALAPVTNVQLTGNTVSITTKGILTKVPYAKALTAGAAALGVGLGIGFVESNPGLATNISNKIFGTDINPDDIVNIVKNTTVWANIVDGATFLAEDFINGIKEAFLENNIFNIGPANSYGSHRQDDSMNCSYALVTGYSNTYTRTYKYKFTPKPGTVLNSNEVIYYIVSSSTNSATAYTRMGGYIRSDKAQEQGVIYGNYGSAESTLDGEYAVTVSLINSVEVSGTNWNGASNGAARPSGYFTIRNMSSWGKYRIAFMDPFSGLSVSDMISAAIAGTDFLPAITIPEVELEDNATYPDSSKTLAQDYPEWWGKRQTSTTNNGEGETSRNWLEVNTNDPTSQEQAQDGTLKDSSQLEDALNGIEETVDENTDIDSDYDPQEQPYPNPNPEPSGVLTPVTPAPPGVDPSDGTSPDPTIPILTTVITSGLSYIYNPTLAQTKALGRKLWTLDFVENLKKIFVDPMQAIIGMHVLYATPKTGSTEDIVLGFYNTEVQSKIVTNQYVTIDCGRISVNEYFKDARDYEPYTKVSAYMPFIGVVDLKADDIINSYINILYNIDVLTGTCLGIIKVIKGNSEAAIYQYVGNCAVTVPLSTGNYTAVLTALLSVAASAVGGAAIGSTAAAHRAGAMFGAFKGAAINTPRAKLQVQQSGSLGANAGALGIRKPYLIIRRPVTNDAYDYNMLYGYPAFKWRKLGGCSGFTRVKSVHLDNVKCSDEEKGLIEEALKDGVIL